MTELQYGVIPQLDKQLKSLILDDFVTKKLIRRAVTESEILEVVSKSTGIPITTMMEKSAKNYLTWNMF